MIILDSRPRRIRTRARFLYDSTWTKEPDCEDRVRDVWKRTVEGSWMFKVKQKLKWCKHGFIQWRKENKSNHSREIEHIKQEMEQMQVKGGNRDWKR